MNKYVIIKKLLVFILVVVSRDSIASAYYCDKSMGKAIKFTSFDNSSLLVKKINKLVRKNLPILLIANVPPRYQTSKKYHRSAWYYEYKQKYENELLTKLLIDDYQLTKGIALERAIREFSFKNSPSPLTQEQVENDGIVYFFSNKPELLQKISEAAGPKGLVIDTDKQTANSIFVNGNYLASKSNYWDTFPLSDFAMIVTIEQKFSNEIKNLIPKNVQYIHFGSWENYKEGRFIRFLKEIERLIEFCAPTAFVDDSRFNSLTLCGPHIEKQ